MHFNNFTNFKKKKKKMNYILYLYRNQGKMYLQFIFSIHLEMLNVSRVKIDVSNYLYSIQIHFFEYLAHPPGVSYRHRPTTDRRIIDKFSTRCKGKDNKKKKWRNAADATVAGDTRIYIIYYRREAHYILTIVIIF